MFLILVGLFTLRSTWQKNMNAIFVDLRVGYLEAPRPVEKFQDGNLEESDQEGKILTNNPPWHL